MQTPPELLQPAAVHAALLQDPRAALGQDVEFARARRRGEGGAAGTAGLQAAAGPSLTATVPYTYPVDVLQRVGEHPASRVMELTPRVWKTMFANDPLRSDLDRARDPPSG